MERLTCKEAAEGFQCFWNQYPVKQNKMACERLWRTMHLMNELTAEIVEQIIRAVQAQKKWEQWRDPTFIPYPDRWLFNRRWEDEERPKAASRGRIVLNNHKPTEPPSAEEQAKIRELLAKRKK